MDLTVPRQTRITVLIGYFLIGFLFSLKIFNVESSYTWNYMFVLFSYFVVTGVWLSYLFRYGFYIFSPVTMVAVLTIITFSIEPMISMLTDDTLLSGKYVYNGCIKATIVYIVGMVAFLWVYYNNFSFGKNISSKISDEWDGDYYKNTTMLVLAYVFVFIGLGVSVLDLLKQGFSLQYILSAGTQGSYDASEDSVGVFINLRYFMMPGFLYLDVYSERKLPKNILRFVAIMCFFLRNKRWIIILLILAPIALHYYKEKRKPPIKLIFLVAVIFGVAIGAMQFMRGISHSVSDIDWSEFGLIDIWKGVAGNFDLYKTLYAAVTYFPDQHFYTMGQQMIYLTIVTCIPRAIWPNKPVSIIDRELKVYFMGQGAVQGAWAYAQMTEFYIEFGWIGVVVCMILFSCFCKYLRRCYIEPQNIHDLIISSMMFPMLMQMVIRGYTPNNFWPIFFMILPVFVMKQCERVRLHSYEP